MSMPLFASRLASDPCDGLNVDLRSGCSTIVVQKGQSPCSVLPLAYVATMRTVLCSAKPSGGDAEKTRSREICR